MRITDIAGMCVQNLRRRPARTLLTALGVLVGSCSIVITISIGVGLGEQLERTLSQMGDLTLITVSAPSGNRAKDAKLDDAAVASFKSIAGVRAVGARLEPNMDGRTFQLRAGDGDRFVYEQVDVVGMDPAVLNDMGYELVEGSWLGAGSNRAGGTTGAPVDALVGQWIAYSFKDSYRPEGFDYVDRYGAMGGAGEPKPFLDVMGAGPVSLVVLDEDEKQVASFPLHPVGRMKEDYSKGMETDSGLVLGTETVRSIVAAVKGSTTKRDSYSSIVVKVDSIDQVPRVEKAIAGMGYSTYSMESIRKPMEKQAAQQQLMLGGLGSISLFVAALGITNTMVMSISERTREIGVMKALGCYVHDIRTLFLAEAGAIGLIGGVAGCLASFAISLAMNLASSGDFSTGGVTAALLGGGETARMSVIPWWLYLFAAAFSLLVGVGSGYYPARRAVRISAIEAIRST